jgi:hypothetical protein
MNLWRYIPMTPLAITAKHSDNFTVTLPPLKIVSNTLQTYRLHKLHFCHLMRNETKSFHSAINLLLYQFHNFNRRTWWWIRMAMPQALRTDGTLIFVTCVTVSFYHALSGSWIPMLQKNRPLPPSQMGSMSPQNVRTTYITIVCHTSEDCDRINWSEDTKSHSYQVIYAY